MKWSPLILLLTFPFHSSHQAQEPQTWWKVPPEVSERQIHLHSICSWSWKWRSDGVGRVLINTYLSMWRTFFPDTESIPRWFDLHENNNQHIPLIRSIHSGKGSPQEDNMNLRGCTQWGRFPGQCSHTPHPWFGCCWALKSKKSLETRKQLTQDIVVGFPFLMSMSDDSLSMQRIKSIL